jgi:hypothetical protein
MPVLAGVKPNHSAIESDKDGVFLAECPVLAGRASQGKTRSETPASIKDLIIEALIAVPTACGGREVSR